MVSGNGNFLERKEAATRPTQKLKDTKLRVHLAEKRTALASVRTGIAVALVPLSLWTALLATWTTWQDVATTTLVLFLGPLLPVAVALLVIGLRLILRSLRDLRTLEKKLRAVRGAETDETPGAFTETTADRSARMA